MKDKKVRGKCLKTGDKKPLLDTPDCGDGGKGEDDVGNRCTNLYRSGTYIPPSSGRGSDTRIPKKCKRRV